MSYDPKFGPAAQTSTQRAYVLRQLQAVFPRLRRNVSAQARQLFDRYVAGELSWPQVREQLDLSGG